MDRRLYIWLLVIFISGCSTPTAYISSLTDPGYKPRKSDPIFLFVADDAPIEDRQFSAFLRTELVAAGFNLTDDILSSEYTLFFRSGENTSKIDSVLFLPQTKTTSGYVGNTYYSGKTTSTSAVPISRNYTVKKLWFELYATSDIANEKYKTVWEGYIGSGINEYRSHQREVLRLLLDVFGTNHQEHTRIRPVPKSN